MHWNSGTNKWDEMASTGAASTVTATTTSFSPFTQGSGGDPLPIDLVSFNGECNNGEAALEFVVASQINNDYFSVHRSNNNQDWTLVGEIAGVGNTSAQMTYQFIDNNPYAGTSYYQLSQTDYDGTSKTFAPIAVTCEVEAIDGYSVYPNPANEVVMIDMDLDTYQGDDIEVLIMDINGSIVKKDRVQLKRGYNHLEINLNDLPGGVYTLQFTGTKNHIKESRIVKQ